MHIDAEIKGLVFDIQRFCVHDGPGIRTTVFLKGCPLGCKWCHNPEGISFKNSLRFFEEKCIGCTACAAVCPSGAQSVSDGRHFFLRERCINCFECASVCPSGAFVASAKEYTAEEIANIALREKIFYRDDGGVTLSGGEALAQPEFTTAVLALCKQAGVSTAVDTCGYIPWENIEMAMPFTDYYLWDIKAYDRNLHKMGCGVYNDLILENFERLDKFEKKISVRIPVIGNFNDNEKEMSAICDFICSKKNVYELTLMPYHSFGKAKYKTLGLEYGIWNGADVSEQRLQELKQIFKDKNVNVK